MIILNRFFSIVVLTGLVSCSGFSPGIVPLREKPIPNSQKPDQGLGKAEPEANRQVGGDVMDKGEALIRSGHYDAARTVYRDYLERYPGGDFTDEALYRLGLLTLFQEDSGSRPVESRRFFQKLLQEFPDSPRAFETENIMNLLGRIEGAGEENTKLRSDLQKLLDLDIQSEKKRKALQE